MNKKNTPSIQSKNIQGLEFQFQFLLTSYPVVAALCVVVVAAAADAASPGVGVCGVDLVDLNCSDCYDYYCWATI